jgi:hypothetical protein
MPATFLEAYYLNYNTRTRHIAENGVHDDGVAFRNEGHEDGKRGSRGQRCTDHVNVTAAAACVPEAPTLQHR